MQRSTELPDVSEPKVSVHGIPQSQYQQQIAQQQSPSVTTPEAIPPPPGGGGLIANMKEHWQVWTIVIGILTIVVIIVIYRLQSASQNAGAATDQSGNYLTGGTTGTGTGSSIDTSGLDAEYNQLISLQNQNNATLAGILSALTGGSSSTGGTTSTGGGGTGTPPNSGFTGTPYGQYGIPQGVNTSDLRNWKPIDSGSAADTEHWDTSAGVPIYSEPNFNASVLRTSPYGQNITTYAAWTARGPLEYSTGTTWSAVQGGGYVPTYSLVPDLNRYVGTSQNPIFGSSPVPKTPFG